MRKSGLTGDEAYALSKRRGTSGDLDPLKKEIGKLKDDLVDHVKESQKAIEDLNDKKITKFYANSLGETTLNDSDKGKIVDMFIFGKSYQYQGNLELEDGTTVKVPNPDYPQEIESVVNPVVKVCGKNLFDGKNNFPKNTYYEIIDDRLVIDVTVGKNIQDTLIIPKLMPGTYTITNHLKENDSRIRTAIYIYKNNVFQSQINTFGNNSNSFSVNEGETLSGALSLLQDGTYENELKVQIEKGSTATEYEPYKEQTATLPYTLNAIPVSSGGNVIIAGQQYVADYVDVEHGKLVKMVDSSKLDNTQSIVNKTEWLLAEPQETDLTTEQITAFKALATYYQITNITVDSKQLDGYTVFNYPISMANGWNYVKQQLNDNRDYIYDMDLQSAEAYVNSEYAVALAELEV